MNWDKVKVLKATYNVLVRVELVSGTEDCAFVVKIVRREDTIELGILVGLLNFLFCCSSDVTVGNPSVEKDEPSVVENIAEAAASTVETLMVDSRLTLVVIVRYV